MTASNTAVDLSKVRRQQKRTVRSDLRELRDYRHLVRYIVSSSLRTEHSGTIFGFLWWIFDPLLLMCVYWLLVGVIFKRSTTVALPVFILVSLLSWTFFTRTVRGSMNASLGRVRAMRQVAFPTSVVPTAEALTQYVHYLIGMAVVAAAAATFYGIYPHWEILLAPFIAFIQMVLALAFAFLLTTANFYFRDTDNLTAYVFRMWYFLSPGLYSARRVPEKYQHLYHLNPFATLFPSYRAVLIYHQMPPLMPLVYVALFAFGLLAVGYSLFIRAEPNFAKLN